MQDFWSCGFLAVGSFRICLSMSELFGNTKLNGSVANFTPGTLPPPWWSKYSRSSFCQKHDEHCKKGKHKTHIVRLWWLWWKNSQSPYNSISFVLWQYGKTMLQATAERSVWSLGDQKALAIPPPTIAGSIKRCFYSNLCETQSITNIEVAFCLRRGSKLLKDLKNGVNFAVTMKESCTCQKVKRQHHPAFRVHSQCAHKPQASCHLAKNASSTPNINSFKSTRQCRNRVTFRKKKIYIYIKLAKTRSENIV